MVDCRPLFERFALHPYLARCGGGSAICLSALHSHMPSGLGAAHLHSINHETMKARTIYIYLNSYFHGCRLLLAKLLLPSLFNPLVFNS